MFYFYRTLLNETHIANIHFTKSARAFIYPFFQDLIFSLNIPNEFALLMPLGIISHILGAREDMPSVPKYTVWFLHLSSSGSFLKLHGFCIKWKVSFITLSHKSFFVLQISVTRIYIDSFGECSLICSFLVCKSSKKRNVSFCRQALKLFQEFC